MTIIVMFLLLISCGLAQAEPSDNSILAAQRMLLQLGYDPGSVDGRLGPLTSTAIAHFQKDQNIPETRELDAATLTRLTEITSNQDLLPDEDGSARHQDRIETAPLPPAPTAQVPKIETVPPVHIDPPSATDNRLKPAVPPSPVVIRTNAPPQDNGLQSDIRFRLFLAIAVLAGIFLYLFHVFSVKASRGGSAAPTPIFRDLGTGGNTYRLGGSRYNGLRDALTTATLDPQKTIYTCSACGVFYHEQSFLTLQTSHEGRCISCGSNELKLDA